LEFSVARGRRCLVGRAWLNLAAKNRERKYQYSLLCYNKLFKQKVILNLNVGQIGGL